MSDQGWRGLLERADMGLAAGCAPADIDAAEVELGHLFPDELATLLLATDGIYDPKGQWYVGWPLARIVADNVTLRSVAGLDPQLLAFGDNGCGEPFCVRLGEQAATSAVYHWRPIEGEASVVAQSLRAFWAGWLSGTIKT